MKDTALCTKTHEYVVELEKSYEVGITDYAIEQLGDIVFIELPEVGSSFSKNEVNEDVVNNPELLNDDSYNEKWLVKIESSADQIEFADLLDYSDYIEDVQ